MVTVAPAWAIRHKAHQRQHERLATLFGSGQRRPPTDRAFAPAPPHGRAISICAICAPGQSGRSMSAARPGLLNLFRAPAHWRQRSVTLPRPGRCRLGSGRRPHHRERRRSDRAQSRSTVISTSPDRPGLAQAQDLSQFLIAGVAMLQAQKGPAGAHRSSVVALDHANPFSPDVASVPVRLLLSPGLVAPPFRTASTIRPSVRGQPDYVLDLFSGPC